MALVGMELGKVVRILVGTPAHMEEDMVCKVEDMPLVEGKARMVEDMVVGMVEHMVVGMALDKQPGKVVRTFLPDDHSIGCCWMNSRYQRVLEHSGKGTMLTFLV